MRIIPVIDLKDGAVVRVGRDNRSVNTERTIIELSKNPGDLVSRITRQFRSREVYISDLDLRWNTGQNNLKIVSQLVPLLNPIEIWLECGEHSRMAMEELGGNGNSVRLVLSSKFVDEPPLEAQAIKAQFDKEPVFCIELYEGQLLSYSSILRALEVTEVITELQKTGLHTFVLLESASTGTMRGLTLPRVRYLTDLAQRQRHVELVVGGGISSINDLHTLHRLGIVAVLIGSAIHEGLITPQMLEEVAKDTFHHEG